MHHWILSSAAALLAFVPVAVTVGTAHVVNNCGFPVYYASVGQAQNANMQEVRGSYSEPYTKPGVGISIKLSPSMNGSVSQFEFTWANGKVYYDLSNIDGSPFADAGMDLVPSMMGDVDNPSCQEVACPAGQGTCNAAYNNPSDVRTTVCSDQSDLTLTICPGGLEIVPNPSPPESSAPATPTISSPSIASQTLTQPTWKPPYHPRHFNAHA